MAAGCDAKKWLGVVTFNAFVHAKIFNLKIVSGYKLLK